MALILFALSAILLRTSWQKIEPTLEVDTVPQAEPNQQIAGASQAEPGLVPLTGYERNSTSGGANAGHPDQDQLVATLLALLPASRIISSVLARAYGMSKERISHVTHAVLGGAGDYPEDGQPVVSTKTEIRYTLSNVEGVRHAYRLKSSVTYTFSEQLRDDRVVIFATCDPALENRIAEAAIPQIFDCWVVSDEDLFRSTIRSSFRTLDIGIRYHDYHDREQERPVTAVTARVIPMSDWGQYLTLFEDDPKLRMSAFEETLVIFEYRLSRREDADHSVQWVDQVTIEASSVQTAEDPHCFWRAPFPCYVDSIRFDVSDFGKAPQERILEFRAIAFMIRGGIVPQDWQALEDELLLEPKSLFLPGHGVALLWRPLNGSGSIIRE